MTSEEFEAAEMIKTQTILLPVNVLAPSSIKVGGDFSDSFIEPSLAIAPT